jgi:serine/threonine protein kinase
VATFGKYEIVRPLATGGMAEIALARVPTVPGAAKLVVLKRMLPQLLGRADYVQMFLDEARLATLLDHPNVVQTFDAGLIDGQPFLAMEYLQGEPVSRLMGELHRRGEPMALEHALAIVIGVCAGLNYAHEKVGLDGRALEIVHRDVNPQNVIVTYDGGVKLVDFGIATSVQRAGKTQHGTIKGKVPYMSPEQCKGEPLDRRSDLFSAGIMLWELTLARRLFRGKNDYEVLKQIVEGRVPPPQEHQPDYDPALEAVVMRALARDPGARQQSARELQGQLEAVARAAHLPTSSLALVQLMERCFGSKIQVMREAEAHGDLELLSQVIEQSLSSADLEELPPADREDTPTRVATPVARHKLAPPRARPLVVAAVVLAAAVVGAAGLLLRAGPATPPATVPAVPAETPPDPPSAARRDPPAAVPEPPSGEPPAPRLPSAREASAAKTAPHRPAAPARRSAAPVEAPPSAGPVRAGRGELVVASSPWCHVAVDGVDRGPTPLLLTLPAGPHTVELRNAEFRISKRFTVEVKAGETVRKSLDFGD